MRKLRPGVVYNPFGSWPPNLWCFCGSGRKFKKCHDGRIPVGCSEHQFETLKKDFEKVFTHVQNLRDQGLPYTLKKPLL